MEKYLLLLYVTVEEENAIRDLYQKQNWTLYVKGRYLTTKDTSHTSNCTGVLSVSKSHPPTPLNAPLCKSQNGHQLTSQDSGQCQGPLISEGLKSNSQTSGSPQHQPLSGIKRTHENLDEVSILLMQKHMKNVHGRISVTLTENVLNEVDNSLEPSVMDDNVKHSTARKQGDFVKRENIPNNQPSLQGQSKGDAFGILQEDVAKDMLSNEEHKEMASFDLSFSPALKEEEGQTIFNGPNSRTESSVSLESSSNLSYTVKQVPALSIKQSVTSVGAITRKPLNSCESPPFPVELSPLASEETLRPTAHTAKPVNSRTVVEVNESKSRKLWCQSCEKIFYSRERYMEHKEKASCSKMFRCKFCTYVCANMSHLKKHMLTKRHTKFNNSTDDGYHICQSCNQFFTDTEKLQKHCAEEHSKNNLTCGLCGFSTNTKSALQNHMLRHKEDSLNLASKSTEKQFPCSDCKQVFYAEEFYRLHRIEGGCMMFCLDCGHIFPPDGAQQYKTHVDKHKCSIKNSCKMCLQYFETADLLNSHKRDGQCLLTCFCCNKQFGIMKKREYQRHILMCGKKMTLTKIRKRNTKPRTPNKTKRVFNGRKGHRPDCYICELCNEIFTAKQFLIQHSYDVHNGENNLTCLFCGYQTSIRVTLERHMIKHRYDHANVGQNKPGRKCIPCKDCNQQFNSEPSFGHHQVERGCIRICFFCNQSFMPDKIEDFQGHLDIHKKRFCYHCDDCNMDFAMKQHKKDGQCIFTCPYCNRKYMSHFHAHYKKHVETCQEKRAFTCSQCGVNFKTRHEFGRHKRQCQERKFTCEICGDRFRTNNTMQYHKRTIHFGQRNIYPSSLPHQCDQCGKTYKGKLQLDKHIKAVHDTKEPFECPTCHKMLKSEDLYYSSHIRVHQPKGRYICEVCGKDFKWSHGRSKHMRQHIDKSQRERPFKCSMCEKSYFAKETLENHVRTAHTGEKPFCCTYCPYRTGRHNNLVIHLDKMHKGWREKKELDKSQGQNISLEQSV